jgi:hypothetical protein
LVTLSGLMYFWRSADAVALANLTLGETRRSSDDGTHNAAVAQYQVVLPQVLVHLFEQHLAKAIVD